MPSAVVEHVGKRVSNLPRRPELRDVIPIGEDGAPSALNGLVERLAHPNRKPLHPPRKGAPVRRLDDHVEVPALHRPVKHVHPKPALGPRDRPYDRPIEPSTAKPKPSIHAKRHMHRHIVRKRRPRIVADARTGLRPTCTLAPPAVSQPVEMKLRLPSASSPTSLGRACGALRTCGHPLEYCRYYLLSRRKHPFIERLHRRRASMEGRLRAADRRSFLEKRLSRPQPASSATDDPPPALALSLKLLYPMRTHS